MAQCGQRAQSNSDCYLQCVSTKRGDCEDTARVTRESTLKVRGMSLHLGGLGVGGLLAGLPLPVGVPASRVKLPVRSSWKVCACFTRPRCSFLVADIMFLVLNLQNEETGQSFPAELPRKKQQGRGKCACEEERLTCCVRVFLVK